MKTINKKQVGYLELTPINLTPENNQIWIYDNDIYVRLNGVTKKLNDQSGSVSSTTSTATLTPSNTTATNYYLTAQEESLTIANPTLNIGQKIVIWVKDDGTARAISFGSDYKVFADNPLPTTTVVGKWMQIIIDKVDTNVVFVSHTVEA